MNVYVGGDVRGIQDFIFASPRLLEMRGASTLLDLFDREVVGRLAAKHKGTKVFAGGGNFLVELPASNGAPAEEVAGPFIRDVKAAFFELTGGHEIVVEVEAEGEKGFPEARKQLDRQIQVRKREPKALRALASFPFLKRCESCAREEADTFHGFKGDDRKLWIGPSCWGKRQMHGRLQKLNKEGRCEGVEVLGLDQTVPVPLPLEDLRQGELPRTFQDLAKDDDLGLVVADGNGLGEMFQDLGRDRYDELSKKVDRALKEALRKALAEVFGENQEHWKAQVLICGGDDLVVALPASKALCFARQLIGAFRVEHEGRQAGMSAGVVFVKPSFPFRTAHDLAEELLRGAKAWCRQDKQNRLAALDFHRVLGTNVQDLAAERKALFPADDDGVRDSWAYGAAGPYDEAGMEQLSKLVCLLRQLPKSQLGRLREILSPRDDSVVAPDLDPDWQVPRRVIEELRYWRSRQAGQAGQKGLGKDQLLFGRDADPGLLVESKERGPKGNRNVHRWVLADALRLAEQREG
ncbi:MAG TPA: hypothetical protein VF017_20680 [Thermoanaerobaculia bacterium]|nr:hypothetical protein [Thermoanaerobaculia bacterium]